MVTEELLDYVRGQRREGVSEQVIREALFSVGWTQEDAEQALSLTALEVPTSAVPNNPPDLEKPVEETAQETSQSEQPGQQEDYLVPSRQTDQPDQAPAEETEPASIKEETVIDRDSQGEVSGVLPEAEENPGPVELNDQGQVIKSSEPHSVVEAQQNTEAPGGLGTDVSSSQVETSPANVFQEPVSGQPAVSAPISNPGEEQPSDGQEQSSQVAVDPKAK